jgi:hypothetical protein
MGVFPLGSINMKGLLFFIMGAVPISTNFTKSKEAAVGYVFVFQ